MSGIAGCSPGYLSAGPKRSAICARVNAPLLPSRCFTLVSGAAAAAGAVPAGGAGGMAYAHGMGPSAVDAGNAATARIKIPNRVRMETLLLDLVGDHTTPYARLTV